MNKKLYLASIVPFSVALVLAACASTETAAPTVNEVVIASTPTRAAAVEANPPVAEDSVGMPVENDADIMMVDEGTGSTGVDESAPAIAVASYPPADLSAAYFIG